jgi:hypothetical protein
MIEKIWDAYFVFALFIIERIVEEISHLLRKV